MVWACRKNGSRPFSLDNKNAREIDVNGGRSDCVIEVNGEWL